ncbi:glycosyltransferase [Hymenobacter caeli]|uniref:Glycosyltransferase involved in cell wall biosynthesis n=1 Tax=Hymenobacter caeli TaxID=2735894 RepID=A0ABX2FKX5_9BACT|nr:glycosyltransferase [Hymenobacter caeli]NRT17787.1 glycosyltransferase involved in cell wall biosynthesis [Hymenobacter caeli]
MADPRLVVLLASVLKPVDEPRMRGKFAETLLEHPGVQVHVAGRGPGTGGAEAGGRLHSHAIFQGSRLGLSRLGAQGRYWQLLRHLRPELVIVHAPELLPLTLLWQWRGAGRRFIYDIQENFALNVRTQRIYGPWVGRALAGALRRVEAWAARRAAGLVLAEASYAAELPFLARATGPVVVLENKYQPAPGETPPAAARPLPGPGEPLQLLFSGTLSELSGVREAVALAEALHAARPGGAHLTVVGFCQQPALLQWLTERAAAHPARLTLAGGARPVPHAAVVAAIGRAHLGLLAYRPHPSSERCQPTKLFEYLALGLPLLVPPNPRWAASVRAHGAGLVVDFADPAGAAAAVLAGLATGPVFYPQGPPAGARWAAEGKKLLALLHLS